MTKPSLTFACGPYDRMEPLYLVEQKFLSRPMSLDEVFVTL